MEESSNERLSSARKEMQNVFNLYSEAATTSNEEKLQQKKQKLQETYDMVTEGSLLQMLQKVEEAGGNQRHGESWRKINQITGRKTTAKGKLKQIVLRNVSRNGTHILKNFLEKKL